jgi:hypothetical protein
MKQNLQISWEQYEASLGERVLARALGQYTGGWDEFDQPLWGLLTLTETTFRFHHFDQANWLTSWVTGGASKEKIISIPREQLNGIDFFPAVHPWWKKLFTLAQPVLLVHYRKDGGEATLHIETGAEGQSFVSVFTPTV